MKKSKIIKLFLVSLLACSCSLEVRNGIEYSSKNVLNEELLNNSVLVDYTETKKYEGMKELGEITFNLEDIVENNTYFLIHYNEDNELGFFSKKVGKYLGNRFYPQSTTYKIRSEFIEINDNGNPCIYDWYGNLLIQGEPLNDLTGYSKNWGIEIFTVNYKSFMYTKNNTPIFVNPSEIDNYFSYSFRTESLKKYGLDGYRLEIRETDAGKYYNYYYLDEAISSIELDRKCEAIGYIDKNLVVQKAEMLEDDAEEFSYIASSYSQYKKFKNHIYFVDLHTGEFKEKDLNIKLYDKIYPLKNADDEVEYYCVSYYDLSINKALEDNYTYVVDKDFVMYDDISYLGFQDLSKLEDGYFYNEKEQIIYDSELNYVTTLCDLDPVYIPEHRSFICNERIDTGLEMQRYKYKKGVINYKGEVIIDFIYDDILSDYIDSGCYLAKRDGKYYQVDTNNNKETELKDIYLLQSHFLMRKENNQMQLFTVDKEIEYVIEDINNTSIYKVGYQNFDLFSIQSGQLDIKIKYLMYC